MSDSPVVVRRRPRRDGPGGSHGDYMQMDDECRQESGVRGCRGCCLCTIVFLLFLLAVINALVSAGLLYFLHITHVGMASLELFSGEKDVRVLQDITFDNLVLHNGLTSGRNKDLVITGDDVLVESGSGSQLHIDGNETVIKGEEFELVTADGKSLFSTSTDLSHDIYQIKNLRASAIDVGSVTSREKYPDLHIESYYNADIVGTEGVQIVSSGDLQMNGAREITIGTKEGKLTLDSKEALFLTPDLPLHGKSSNTARNGVQLKLCVCANSGRIFAVKYSPPNGGCDKVAKDNHPCEKS